MLTLESKNKLLIYVAYNGNQDHCLRVRRLDFFRSKLQL